MPSTEHVRVEVEDQLDPAHSALVMVDLQNDFVHPQGWVAHQRVKGFAGDSGVAAVLPTARDLLAAARTAGVLVMFVRMVGDDKYLSGPLRALYRRNHAYERPGCVLEGTWGADFYDGLGPLTPNGSEREIVVDKHRYSSFIGTRLDQALRSHGVDTIVTCGVATSGCVESTVRDGFMLDYYAVTVGDACADYSDDRHQASLSKMHLSFGTVVDTASVVRQWSPVGVTTLPA